MRCHLIALIKYKLFTRLKADYLIVLDGISPMQRKTSPEFGRMDPIKLELIDKKFYISKYMITFRRVVVLQQASGHIFNVAFL